MQWAADSES